MLVGLNEPPFRFAAGADAVQTFEAKANTLLGVNRELITVKRIFSLAVESGKLATKLTIKMLSEAPACSGFFEREPCEAVLRHLPADVRPVIEFADITGWRVDSEILPLEWRQVDFQAGEVQLDPKTTKNSDGRTFPLTDDLRAVLTAQWAAAQRVRAARLDGAVGVLPDDREGPRGTAVPETDQETRQGVEARLPRGRMPRPHSAPSPANSRPEHGPQRGAGARRHAARFISPAARCSVARRCHRSAQRGCSTFSSPLKLMRRLIVLPSGKSRNSR